MRRWPGGSGSDAWRPDEVRAACAGAPAHRNWLESGLAFVGDVFVGVFEAVVDLGKLAMLPMTLLNDLTSDLAALATEELTPEELAMDYQLKAEDAEAPFTAATSSRTSSWPSSPSAAAPLPPLGRKARRWERKASRRSRTSSAPDRSSTMSRVW